VRRPRFVETAAFVVPGAGATVAQARSLCSAAVLRTLEGRAQLTVIALWVTVAASIADAYAHVNRLRIVQDAVDAQLDGILLAVPADVIGRADDYVSITLVVSTVMLVVTAVLWMTWQVAAHRRLQGAITGWRAEPRMSIVGWVVPVVNLAAPVLVVAALLRAAGRRSTWLLVAWWATWIAATVLAGLGTANPQDLADQRTPDALAMIGDALSVAAAVLAIGVVRRLQDGLGTAPGTGPGPTPGDAQAASA